MAKESVKGMAAGGGTIVMANCFCEFWGVVELSLQVTVKLVVPAVEGVPEITRLLPEMEALRPVGSGETGVTQL